MRSLYGHRRLIVVLTVLVGGFILYFPARALVSQRDRIGELEERRAVLAAENQRLSAQAERLSDPAELEVLARERLGLVRPGERVYVVEATAAPQKAKDPDASPSAWSRLWSWVTERVRGND